MWIFGKKDKQKPTEGRRAQPAPASASKEEKVQALLAQMREIRAEIGEENLQKMADKLRLEQMKAQMRHDIDNDEKKRQRLLDEIRWQALDDGR